jgi:hypothetical protein
MLLGTTTRAATGFAGGGPPLLAIMMGFVSGCGAKNS